MRRVLGLILTGLLCFIIWATIGSGVENLKIDLTVSKFVKSATLIEEKSTEKIKYYEVKSKFELEEPTTTVIGNREYPGYMGDIICAKTADINYPILYEGVTYYVGGHAALCGFPYESKDINFDLGDTFEITGFGSDITAKVEDSYDFLNGHYKEFMVYRVNTTLENRFKAFVNAMSYYGQSYNYFFIINKDSKKFCSDLVSRAYKEVGIDLDSDGVAPTILDIMSSPYVYLTYYSKLDRDGTRHIYKLV